MKKEIKNETKNYCEDAMANIDCLICGERKGDHSYLGKAICPECLDYIRANY